MVTQEMKDLLKEILDKCNLASEIVYEDGKTLKILNACDHLVSIIDEYLESK